MAERPINIETQARQVHQRLYGLYPDAKTALRWSTPIELMIAVILSAQCTDVRVNQVTEGLFKKYRAAADFAGADEAVFQEEVRPTGFFRNKARNIIASTRMIVEEYGGAVPDSMPEMLRLPGIARKSANIILAESFGVIEGMPVDTHVKRLTNRLGLSAQADPEKIEKEMMTVVPRADWYRFSGELIYHGRAICVARKPKCGECVLNDICPSAFVGRGRVSGIGQEN